ncbi:MAG: UTP--glucose-1-phosphate uridylyltransferase [Thermoguttaceae bacterium]
MDLSHSAWSDIFFLGMDFPQGARVLNVSVDLGVCGRDDRISEQTRQKIHDSFILVHGGMAQNVGPILEMVTEKYLLRSEAEWQGRQEAIKLMNRIEAALCDGDIRALAEATTENFYGPIQKIIPWATNLYTQTLIERMREKFGDRFWGFLMLGGMSGGGMGFIVDPKCKPEARDYLLETMRATKRTLHASLPFAMEPVVYDFSINGHGSVASLRQDDEAFMPPGYYALIAPQWLRSDVHRLAPASRNEIERFAAACRTHDRLSGSLELLFSNLFPKPDREEDGHVQLGNLLEQNVDTLGADLDPAVLGLHLRDGACLTFEVIGRRIEDRGGGLARVNGQVRLVETLAMPREKDEFKLTYYNTLTTWIDIDKLLDVFGLKRDELFDEPKVTAAVRRLSWQMPTYVTLKDVKKRWGHGQEDVFPVAQFEKLWGDMTGLPQVACRFVVVPRMRGQQLKDQAQLDAWLRDGSAAHVDGLCKWA